MINKIKPNKPAMPEQPIKHTIVRSTQNDPNFLMSTEQYSDFHQMISKEHFEVIRSRNLHSIISNCQTTPLLSIINR